VKRPAVIAIFGLAVAGCGGSSASQEPDRAVQVNVPSAECAPMRVNYGPYPGYDRRLDGIAWIEGTPRTAGLIALLWYWPDEWYRRRVEKARIVTGGVSPDGMNMKIMWVFKERSAKDRAGNDLLVTGRRHGGPGRYRGRFPAVGYGGPDDAPSYASIIDLPKPGCWRLTAATGRLRAAFDLRAVGG